MPRKELCTKTLTAKEIERFVDATEDEYYFEMFLDHDIPVWGWVGEVEAEDMLLGHISSPRHFIYTHLDFRIGYNGGQIVSVNATTPQKQRRDITTDDPQELEVKFTYSVTWVAMDLSYENRNAHNVASEFLPTSFEIHWLSIINSFVLVILLTAFLAIILMRVLKNDFSRYMQADDEEDPAEEETGWKLIHGDVFRMPSSPMLFTACLGAGAQLFATTLVLFTMVIVGVFNPIKRGNTAQVLTLLYILFSGVGGCVSARFYKQMGGERWVWNVVLCASIYSVPFTGVFAVLNSVAIGFNSTAALPFGTIMVYISLFFLLAFPLTIVGGIVGRNMAGDFEAPCRTTKVARQIPEIPWYRQGVAQLFVAGFLPFSAIYIELHYIFASVWGHKSYTLFGILFLAFLMLVIVTSFINVALTYFQLAIEDHRWWWRSLCSGGATGLFMFGYCFFYYFERSEMNGLLQTAFFFGYMAAVSYGFFLMLGFVGFTSSLTFVKYIYGSLKIA